MSRFSDRQHRRVVRRLALGLERLSVWRPALGVALCARLARATVPNLRDAYGAPSAARLEALLGSRPSGEIERLRTEIAAQELRNAAVRRVFRAGGSEALAPLLARVEPGPLPELRRQGRPVVTVGWHQGPSRAHALALERLGIPFLMPTTREAPGAEAAGFHRLDEDLSDARFLREAHTALAEGRVAAVNLDWRHGHGHPVTVLGRRLHLGRGVAWLARTRGAAVVPATRRWVGTHGIATTFHDPLPASDAGREDAEAFEAALLDAIAAWFDAFLRREPGTLRTSRLRLYEGLPRAAAPTAASPITPEP